MEVNALIKVLSWNINRSHHPIKGKKILSFLKKEKVSIALLQETHLNKLEHNTFKEKWVGQVYLASYNSKSRGVIVLINKNLPVHVDVCEVDPGGCYIFLHGYLFGGKITILNVHVAPNAPVHIFTKLTSLLVEYHCALTIVGGDWNCVLDPTEDKSPAPRLQNLGVRSKAVLQMMDEVALVDLWRLMNPSQNYFSFYSNPHKMYSRIDMILIPNVSIDRVTKSDIGSIFISDHAPTSVNLSE